MNDQAEILHQAAARLRELAAKATSGPWSAGHKRTVVAKITGKSWGLIVARDVDDVDRDWITTMSPAVAEPLAALLESYAQAIDGAIDCWGAFDPISLGKELALARAILGGES